MLRKVHLLIGAFAALAACSDHLGAPFQGKCIPEGARPESTARAAGEAALAFVSSLVSEDPSAARSLMTITAQASTSAEQLTRIRTALTAASAEGAPKIVASFLLSLAKPPATFAFVPCLAQSSYRGVDLVGAGPYATQSYVVVSMATGEDNASAFSISLRLEQGSWRIERFHFDPIILAGRDGYAWWALAQEQARKGHTLNAALLLQTAKRLLFRGPDYQPGGLAEVSRELANLPTPRELQGRPPYNWSLDNTTFRVASLGVYGIGPGKALLMLVQQPSDWGNEAEAEASNRRLIDAFIRGHPEWSEAFDAVGSRTCNLAGKCYRIIYQGGAGYTQA